MIYYKSVRYIDGKSRWIMEDEYGNIIKDPTKEQLKLAMLESSEYYRNNKLKGRKCYICNKDLSLGKDHGRKEYDINGTWTGNWLCTTHWVRIYYNKPLCRNGKLYIYSTRSKGFLGEAIIAKVRNLDIMAIKSDNFNSMLDLSADPVYMNIQAKLRLQLWNNWYTRFGIEHNFDTLFSLCADKSMKNIVRAYTIPEDELYGITSITIYGNERYGAWNKFRTWENFRIDEKPYNDAHHSLMEFLKDKKYFGIEDIKKWLNDGR